MSPRVLVVEPSVEEFFFINDSLRSQGTEVQGACCLEMALEKLQAAQIPVVLYDTDAPEAWLAVLQRLLPLQPDLRVVFLSRLADEHMWIDVLEAGAYDLLMKPLRAQELRCVVRNALGSATMAA